MRIRIAVAVALACCAGTAGAADWSFDPKVSLSVSHNDNNRLTDVPGDEVSVTGGEVDAQLTMRAETPRSTFRLVPRIEATVHPDDDEEDTEDPYLHMDWGYRGERSEATIDANYSLRTITGRYFPDSEVPDDGELGEPVPGEGITRSTDTTEEERLDVSPAVAFQLSERTALEMEVSRLDVDFDQQVAGDREDYSNMDGSVGLHFKTSPSATLAVVAGASIYDPDGGTNIDAHRLNLEWSNKVSDTSQIFLSGGAYRVESDDVTGSDWETGFSGGAGVRWSFEVTKLFVDFNRYLDPSSFGNVVQRDQLRLQWSRRLGPLTTMQIAARGIRDTSPTDDIDVQDRDYATAAVDFDWRISRQFTFSAGYQYTWREYDDQPNSAESNQVYVGVTYEPHRL